MATTARTYVIERYGRKFRLQVDDRLMEDHYRKGELCEWHMLDWIEHNIPRGGLWVDAGANIGNHAITFALWADLVLALEPMPVNFALLEANLSANEWAASRVVPLRIGAGLKAAFMGAKLGGTGQNCQWEMTGEGLIPIIALDSVIPERADVRLLKLDVEGMENEVIAGALDTIRRCRPEIFVEIWDDDRLEAIKAFLATMGYRLIERWNVAPTYHFSASSRYKVTYKPPR